MIQSEQRRDRVIDTRRALRGALGMALQNAYVNEHRPKILTENTLTQWQKIIEPQDIEYIEERIDRSLLHFNTILLEHNTYYDALAETYVLGPYKEGQQGYWYLSKMAMTASELALLAEMAIYHLHPPIEGMWEEINIHGTSYPVSRDLGEMYKQGLFSPAMTQFDSPVPLFIDQHDKNRAEEITELIRRMVEEGHILIDQRSVSAVFMHQHQIGGHSGSFHKEAKTIEAWMRSSSDDNVSVTSTIVHELAHSNDHLHAFGALKEIHARYHERQALLHIERTGFLNGLINPDSNDTQIYRINNWFARVAAGIVQDHTSPMFIDHNVHGAAWLNTGPV